MINSIHSDFSTKIVQTLRDDPNMQQIITELQNEPSSHPQYSWSKGQLMKKGSLVVGNNNLVKNRILDWMHDSAQGGHSGVEITYNKIKSLFNWQGLKQYVTSHVKNCLVCKKVQIWS